MTKNTSARNFYTENRRKLRASMAGAGAELAVISGHSFVQASGDRTLPFEQDSHFFYLTGLVEAGLILVIEEHKDYLIIPARSQSRVAFEGAVNTSELTEVSGIEKIYEAEEGWERLKPVLKKSKKTGILMPSDEYLPSVDMFTNPSRRHLMAKLKTAYDQVDFTDVRPALVALRMIKADYEVEMIELAIAKTAEMLGMLELLLPKAKNECELMAAVSSFAINAQLPFAYEPIIAGGANAVTLHYEKNNAALKKGELLLLDLGLKHNGYSADISRTISIGDPTNRQQKVYRAVNQVQGYAIGLIKPGVSIKDCEEKVADRMGEQLKDLGLISDITKENIRKYYPHATSHYLGLDVHDVADYERMFEAGMVLTVEPGIYIPEEAIGVRIEDNILVTSDGCRILSKELPHSLESLTINP